MQLPVWVASSEFECCQPHVAIGDVWQPWLHFSPESWWLDSFPEPISPSTRNFGIAAVPASEPGARAFTFATIDGVDTGGPERRGCLRHEAHMLGENFDPEALRCRGIVRRIRVINFDRDARMGLHMPIAMQEPIDVGTTRQEPDENGEVEGCDEYLIDLEIT